MGEWHISWQRCAPFDSIEVGRTPHRADIVGVDGRVIELQSSPLPVGDIANRENFYGDMIWLFDATKRFQAVEIGSRVFFNLGNTKHLDRCTKPTFLDFGYMIVEVESFSRAIAKLHGFGIKRSRQWFADQFLYGVAPKHTGGKGKRSIGWGRHQHTTFPTKWNTSKGAALLPKGTAYLPMKYYEVGIPKIYEWERVLNQHASTLGNGWTRSDLSSMKDFLNGTIVIIDGVLRLLPAPLDEIRVNCSAAGAMELLAQAENHISAGRLPILKDETKQHLIQSAKRHEASLGGRRNTIDLQGQLFE